MKHFQRGLFALLALAVVLTFSTCSEDPEEPTGTLYKVVVPSKFDNRYVKAFISDEAGNILDQGAGGPGKTIKLYAPEEYTGTVHAHYLMRIKYDGGYDYWIDTYPAVQPGWELKLSPVIILSGELPGELHTLEVNNIPNGYTYARYSGPGISLYSFQNLIFENSMITTLKARLDESGALTYLIFKEDDTEPRYYHLENAEGDGFAEADFSEFQTPEVHNFNIGVVADWISVSVNADDPDKGQLTYAGIQNSDNINLFRYPAELFPNVRSSIAVWMGNERHYYYPNGLPTSMRWVDAEVSAVNVSGNTVTVDITGDYDFLSLYRTSSWNTDGQSRYLSWFVRMYMSNTITLPDLCAELAKDWPEFADQEFSFNIAEIAIGGRTSAYRRKYFDSESGGRMETQNKHAERNGLTGHRYKP